MRKGVLYSVSAVDPVCCGACALIRFRSVDLVAFTLYSVVSKWPRLEEICFCGTAFFKLILFLFINCVVFNDFPYTVTSLDSVKLNISLLQSQVENIVLHSVGGNSTHFT